MQKLLGRALGGALCLFASVVPAGTVSLADLARQEQFIEVRISGDGKYLAATTVVKDKPMLALINIATQKGAMVTPREGNQVVDFWWVNDHRVLYTEGTKVAGWDRPFATGEIFGVNADGSGGELLFGYRASDGRGATHIQRREPERASAELLDIMRGDDKRVLIGVTPWDSGADGAFTQIFQMDVNDGSKHQVGTAPLRGAEFLVDHHGVVRFAMGMDVHAYPQVFYRENADKPWSLLFQGTADQSIPWPVAFNRDDSTVYMTCSAAGAVAALCPWSVASSKMNAPVWQSATVGPTGLVRSLDRLDIVGVYSDPGTPTAQAIVPDADTIKVIGMMSRALPGESVSVVSSTDDGSKAVVLARSDMDPGTYYLWDSATGKASLLAQRASWIKPEQMASMQPVEFKARDGLAVHGYLSLPPGKEQAKHLPMVVYVHGGPFGVRDRWEFDPYVQMLATRGYAVLQVNFRGSGGYGDAFLRAGYREWGGKMQDDVTDATHWAIEQGIANPGRICIFGGSYGGYAALEGAVKEPDLYRCAIGYVGVYDLNLLYSRGDASDSTKNKSFLRFSLGEDSAQLAARSPINQLDKLKAGLMLIVGGEDTRVPPAHADELRNALGKRGIGYEWLFKPDEGHGFYTEANRTELFEKVNQFLDRQIGNGGGGSATGAP
ncbi:S9 family peptidase [Dyella sp. C9]|uniref:alpha/beta hydrolase family protein n=1 Tax=Dyella sp. C9 TaxID=2202154 RepID=UPI000DEFED28|nr:S9 family peptidase [Dyella sp. C9]